MADDNKTEKATPKRRRELREKGNVCKSPDLAGSVLLITSFWAIKNFGFDMTERMAKILEKCVSVWALTDNVNVASLTPVFIELALDFFLIIAPVLGVALLVGIAIDYAQIGFLQVKDPMTPKWDKINPVNGFKRMFSPKSLVQTLKTVIKFSVLGYIVYNEMKKVVPEFPALMQSDLRVSIEYIVEKIFSVAYKLGLAYVFIGVADYGYSKWDYERGIRMTKQEIKEEYKMTEGDPQIKGKIKQKQQQMSLLRMMAEVAEADVVITNPTHYAVALKYDDEKSQAPIVLAKGKDFVAIKLKEKAAEHGIKMIENKPLAQALYATVEVGEEIPPEFYAAVAEILAEIYRLKRRK